MPCRVIGLKVKNAGPVEDTIIGEGLPDWVPAPPGSDEFRSGVVNADPVNWPYNAQLGV